MEEQEASAQEQGFLKLFTLVSPLDKFLYTVVLPLYPACEEDPASPMLATVKNTCNFNAINVG
jgi:hypothetical protein